MDQKFKHWEQEKKLIPVMIKIYCHGNHHTKGNDLCEECKKLTEYALFRLDKCPFKENKGFCSFCKIHCYKPEMKEKIRLVMKYSGPRMIFTHPIFALKHPIALMKYKRMKKRESKEDINVK